MSGRILIVDSVATNRIILRAKVLAAQYQVVSCATCEEARAAMSETLPDLMLINLSDPTEDRHAFCENLRQSPLTKHVPIVSVGSADTAKSRFAALDAGADDVLPRPVSDTLLLARIRSLLRRRHIAQDLQLRDGTSHALGFDEAVAPRITPARINVLSNHRDMGLSLVAALQSDLSQSARLMTTQTAHTIGVKLPAPDLFVIDGSASGHDPDRLYHLVSDLLARVDTRQTRQLIVVPKTRPDMAAMVLDLGAHDVVFADVAADEIALRVRQLIAQKTQADSLRDRVRQGLNAAVTDPLTGLFNRRYAETHLNRISAQAHAAGCDYALMMLDIDHFKAINDTYGHAAGDMVLHALADRLRDNVRAIDMVARVGGEEFMVVMPNTPHDDAEYAAERIRKLVNARPFNIGEAGPDLPVTVSVGVAVDMTKTRAAMPPAQLFEQADAALYDAKSSGRNTIVMSKVAA